MTLWAIRILFLALCTVGGYEVSQVRPELISNEHGGLYGMMAGFGFGGFLIAIDEMVKGLSLRAFSAATCGLLLGSIIAWLVDRSELFVYVESRTQWIVRLALFMGFSYIGMVLAMRSNKEDFSLIIPYVRFSSQSKPENFIVLDTSAIIDGRIADLLEARFVEGTIVVPRFVLKELQQISDSSDTLKRARGRRGLEMLNRIQHNPRSEVKLHEGDFPEEAEVDAKLVRLTKAIGGKLFTNDYNLSKIAELQSVPCLNLHELSARLKPVILPGELLSLRIVREGKDKGQGIGYLNDGTMVVVNQAQTLVGQQAQVQVQSLLQTGAGVIVFADLKSAA
ncbi:MAG: PilT protein domain protein [Verrucomicrobiales bacterium]|nr:PilT protein domain protein [Verrucomicrobiales bacterium]